MNELKQPLKQSLKQLTARISHDYALFAKQFKQHALRVLAPSSTIRAGKLRGQYPPLSAPSRYAHDAVDVSPLVSMVCCVSSSFMPTALRVLAHPIQAEALVELCAQSQVLPRRTATPP